MKSYKQFIDEALIPSLIKAAARQIFKSRGLQKGLAKVGTQVPKVIKLPSKVTGFQTARGSKYTYERKPGSWPTTQRTAVHDPYHPTPAGKTQKSTATMFTTPDASLEMKRRFQYEPKTPYHQGLPLSKTPGIGKAPVEVFNKYDKLGDRSAIHAGNPITDLKTKLPGPKNNIGLFGSQRKELKTRVNTALQNPNNRAVLKKEMGMKEDYRKTFAEFIEEAKRIRVLRTAHYTDSSTQRSMLDQGLRSGTRSDGTYHDKGMNVLYTTPSSRVGADYGGKRVNFKVINPKVTRIDSPKTYGSRFKDWMANASEDDLVNNKNRPETPFKQSRSAIRGGAKVINVPDAHGGHDQPKKGNRGSYVILDKDLANKSIDRNPSPIMRARNKPRRTQTQSKKK